jgi:hypothetical protein
MSESNSRAPYIVRQIPLEEIERGQRLQKAMEAIDALEAKKLADELKADDEARRVEQERAATEETRRSASPAGRYMDSKYGWVNNTKV